VSELGLTSRLTHHRSFQGWPLQAKRTHT